MKYLNTFLIILFVLLTGRTDAALESKKESSATFGEIKGKIKDSNGEGLIGVNVFLQNTALGSATDENGEFNMKNIPIGQYRIIASMVGYESVTKSIEVNTDETTEVDFILRPAFYETGTIVVTGTATQYLYEESPVKTEVIPRKLIEQTKSSNLAEALGLQTGVRIENNCQNCNFTQVRILGFDGKYSQVLIDGDPVVSSLAGVYALEQFPQEMIGQLEVVKGGGSALYGGGAIAGTINIISKRPQLNRTKINYQGQSLEGNLENKLGVMSELVSDNGKTGAFIYGSARNRSDYDRNGDGFSEIGVLTDETVGFNWFFKPEVNNQLNINVHRIHEDRRGGNDFDLPQHEADIAEWLDHLRWGGKVKWEHSFENTFDYSVFYSFSKVDRKSYYGGLVDDDGDGVISETERLAALDFYGFAESFTQSFGGRTNLIIGNQKFTAGVEYYADDLEDNSVKDERYHIDETNTNFGAYIQDDISFMDNHLNIILGARLDKHSKLDDPVISPRVNLKYEVIKGLDLRASLTTGFKAPQTFDEDLHIEALGGDQRVVRNSSGLKEESSKSISGGIEYQGFWDDVAVIFGLTGFYMYLDDAFSTQPLTETAEGLSIWERINTDGAEVKGFEIDMGIRPIQKLEVRAGFTYKSSKFDSEQEIFDGQFTDKFIRTPDEYGFLRVSYDPDERVNVFSSVRYTGKMVVPNESIEQILEPDETFFEFDLGFSYKVPAFDYFGGKINLGIKNIFDSYQEDLGIGADRDPAYVYGPQLPRRIYFGFETEF
ncbi:MAG: TonB-dependent receptor [Ignavibacteria bacterium]|jgi:outer membrane receptor for ferrienterochelin and colicins